MITPIGIGVSDWFDSTTLDLVQYGVLPRYSGDWKEVAALWLQNPNITSKQVPRPEPFDDWREWASRFNQAIFG